MPDRQPTPSGAVQGPAPRTGLRQQLGGLAWQPDGAKATTDGSPSWRKRRVLLLNTTFEPLTALPLRRAIVLVVCGKAEIVHGDPAGLMLRSATTSLVIPSVIRLSYFVRVPHRGRAPLTRSALMHRDGHRCVYCGARAETIDHVVPRSKGGTHAWENCVACCTKCNHRKADKTLNELGWQLPMAPKAPRGRHWRLLAGLSEADPLWLPYLGEPLV